MTTSSDSTANTKLLQSMSGSPRPSPTLVISELPPKTLVGIDLFSFTSTPNFYGVKDLPEGAHFLYTGATESFSLRCGEWLVVRNNGDIGNPRQLSHEDDIDIRLRKWDKAVENIVPLDENNDLGRQEAMKVRANLGVIWASGGLLSYQSQLNKERNQIRNDGDGRRFHSAEHSPSRIDWQELSRYITPMVLNRILGEAGFSNPHVEERWTISSGSSAAKDADHIPGLSKIDTANAIGIASEHGKELMFLPIDLKRTWREGAIGRERTEAAQDRSWALGDIIRHVSSISQLSYADKDTTGEEQLLGELQFTFLMILTLMNFSCMEQWKRLLSLVLTCRSAITEREPFFVEVLQLLRLQMRHFDDVEGGLFEMDGDDSGILLRKLLTTFKQSVEDIQSGYGTKVKEELACMEAWVISQYGWELSRDSIVRRGLVELEDGEQVEMELNGAEAEDETGEYAPLIVELEEGSEESSRPDMDMQM
ncbi:hypothetical protein LOZ58_002097 [Ophidiomyces ophidiicola]|nr:hypothetical protein LOZ58_002097 [Ophidiomyces ophidiicola]